MIKQGQHTSAWALRLAWTLSWPGEAALYLLWRRRLWNGPMWRRELAAWALAHWGSLAYNRHAWRNGMSFDEWLGVGEARKDCGMTEQIWLTIYEPRRRWHGQQACRYSIERHVPVPPVAIVTTLAEGWLPNVGLGYITLPLTPEEAAA